MPCSQISFERHCCEDHHYFSRPVRRYNRQRYLLFNDIDSIIHFQFSGILSPAPSPSSPSYKAPPPAFHYYRHSCQILVRCHHPKLHPTSAICTLIWEAAVNGLSMLSFFLSFCVWSLLGEAYLSEFLVASGIPRTCNTFMT